MTRFLAIFGLLALLATGMIFWGCGKDSDSPVTPVGSFTDPEYIVFAGASTEADSAETEALSLVFAAIAEIGSDQVSDDKGQQFNYSQKPLVAGDSISVTYDSVSGYWHIYRSHSNPIAGRSWVFSDSLQFRDSEGFMKWPNAATLTEIRNGLSHEVTYSMTAANGFKSGTKNHTREFTIVGAPGAIAAGGNVVIDGTGGTITSISRYGGCTSQIIRQSTYDQLALNINDFTNGVCPTGGTITQTGSLNASCPTDNGTVTYTGNWTVVKTFDGENVIITATKNGRQWTYSGPCPPPQS